MQLLFRWTMHVNSSFNTMQLLFCSTQCNSFSVQFCPIVAAALCKISVTLRSQSDLIKFRSMYRNVQCTHKHLHFAHHRSNRNFFYSTSFLSAHFTYAEWKEKKIRIFSFKEGSKKYCSGESLSSEHWPETRRWPLPSNVSCCFPHLVTFYEGDILPFLPEKCWVVQCS